jgi:hypothetical protein
MTPSTPKQELRIERKVFDLDSKSDVELAKVIPDWTGITTMAEFNERLGSDHKRILEVLNKGLKEFESEKLAENPDVAWQKVGDDGELSEFVGTPISAEMSEKLAKTVLAVAAMSFGYAKEMIAGDVEKNREAKKKAKADALAFILSAPGAIERLKAS